MAVEERRARLRALREDALASGVVLEEERHEEQNNGDGPQNGDEVEEQQDEGSEEEKTADLPPVRFRNYLPRDEELQKLKREPPVLPSFDNPVAEVPSETKNAELDPMRSIAPKKANWDLRRDVAKKLEKLEKRTTRAIIELMEEEKENRKRLGFDQEQEDDEA